MWGLSPSDNNSQINNYKNQNGITNPCAGTQGGGPQAINVVTTGQPFIGYPTYIIVCPDKTVSFDICWPPTVNCFNSYFEDCIPVTTLEAVFEANTSELCQNGEVAFTDQSVGTITSWEWTFEGGTPASSNEQNPVVVYEQAGEFDVELTVSDGTNTNTMSVNDYIFVQHFPVADAGSAGETCVDLPFTISDATVDYSNDFWWEVISGNGSLENETSITPTYIPASEDAGSMVILQLKASGIGSCEVLQVSSDMEITINALPMVSLADFGEVCIDWTAFGLSGGFPEGGEYSGDGVSGNMFSPMDAGMGTHIITYTFIDENSCTAFAEAEIEVTACVGIDQLNQAGLSVYPNPSTGIFQIDVEGDNSLKVMVINQQGQLLFTSDFTSSTTLNLEKYPEGIYYLRLVGHNETSLVRLVLVRN